MVRGENFSKTKHGKGYRNILRAASSHRDNSRFLLLCGLSHRFIGWKMENGSVVFTFSIRRSAMNETVLFWSAYFLIVLAGLGVLGVSWV